MGNGNKYGVDEDTLANIEYQEKVTKAITWAFERLYTLEIRYGPNNRIGEIETLEELLSVHEKETESRFPINIQKAENISVNKDGSISKWKGDEPFILQTGDFS